MHKNKTYQKEFQLVQQRQQVDQFSEQLRELSEQVFYSNISIFPTTTFQKSTPQEDYRGIDGYFSVSGSTILENVPYSLRSNFTGMDLLIRDTEVQKIHEGTYEPKVVFAVFPEERAVFVLRASVVRDRIRTKELKPWFWGLTVEREHLVASASVVRVF